MIPIHLAVEDDLSESVARRLLLESPHPFEIRATIRRDGYGYIKSRIHDINRSAQKGVSFFVLTDLDKTTCPSALIRAWLGRPLSPNLLFRIAVREVEAWILGDSANLAKFLRISEQNIPLDPELLDQPKEALIRLASKSRSAEIRRRLTPRPNRTAIQGPEYNPCLAEFVQSGWDPQTAALACPSLARCIAKIHTFQPKL